jgi:hypothetical protein
MAGNVVCLVGGNFLLQPSFFPLRQNAVGVANARRAVGMTGGRIRLWIGQARRRQWAPEQKESCEDTPFCQHGVDQGVLIGGLYGIVSFSSQSTASTQTAFHDCRSWIVGEECGYRGDTRLQLINATQCVFGGYLSDENYVGFGLETTMAAGDRRSER